MNLDPILDRLQGVRRIRDGQYLTNCPAHDDKHPSLEIKDGGDRALLICRAGCSFDEIRVAIGMQAHEFFQNSKSPKPVVPGVTRRELYEALALELATAYVVTCDRAKGKPITEADAARELLARKRIAKAWRANS